jgi:hypothetical protein
MQHARVAAMIANRFVPCVTQSILLSCAVQIALKAADLCNLCDPHHMHLRWVNMLEEEVSGRDV